LLALLKQYGGIRPIAVVFLSHSFRVALRLRRVTANIVSKAATSKLSPFLAPLQLGVVVKGGMEAAVHVTRHYLQTLPSSNMAVLTWQYHPTGFNAGGSP